MTESIILGHSINVEPQWIEKFKQVDSRIKCVAIEDIHNIEHCDVLYLSFDLNMQAEKDPATLKALANLGAKAQWVQAGSAGVDGPLHKLIYRDCPKYTNAAGIHAIPISQYVLGQMLGWIKHTDAHRAQQEEKLWQTIPGIGELTGQRVGIIGYGGIGREVARLSKAFGMHVTGVKRSQTPEPELDVLVTPDDIDQVLEESDFIVSILPAAPETENLFNARTFGLMKSSCVFINVGRGIHVDEKSMIDCLESGGIAAAYIDTTVQEPLSKESALWTTKNLYISPHDSAFALGAWPRLHALFLKNLEKFVRSEPLDNLAAKN